MTMNNEMLVTKKGKAMWTHINEPEMYNGEPKGYTVQIMLSKEDTDELIGILNGILNDAKKDIKFKGKGWSSEPFMGIHEDKDGNILFKFKANTSYKDKDGVIHDISIPVFDSKGNPFPKGTNIGNGSIIRVAFTPTPFNVNKRINGLSLRLNSIQVVKLVPYGNNDNNAKAFGFSVEEDGYVAPPTDTTTTTDEDEPVVPPIEDDNDFADF